MGNCCSCQKKEEEMNSNINLFTKESKLVKYNNIDKIELAKKGVIFEDKDNMFNESNIDVIKNQQVFLNNEISWVNIFS